MEVEVLSNNILIKNPFFKKEKSILKVDDKIQEEMLMAEISKAKRLLVTHVGSNCTKVKAGDEVYIDIDRTMNSPRITLGEQDFFILREPDVIFIYKDSGNGNRAV